MNITQAYKELVKGNNVYLYCKYFEREEKHIFDTKHFGYKLREDAFKHLVKCIKNDFKDISTFYFGNKSNCKFTWKLT